ncbi:cyclase family protein [Paenibacillus eucommiae]|uniref:Kynurenine formamidase n=1 Tax=Paenibacillus eucommiae TaxID=1355755 RepID=A0ABS4JB21_9BACL|nr:cyclase family protein [Paenibacillus eucommiae]MBP1996281.1 kynurenine formamidase [Paenibacillus eucommiae]
MKYVRLSYDLAKSDPGWPGSYSIDIEPYTQIARGDVANQYKITLLNHFGSHMDGPKHFNEKGPRLAEMPLSTFIMEHPLLLDIPKSFSELVRVEDLLPYEDELQRADSLFIRSGFSKFRESDKIRYASEGVGISSQACQYIMDRCPNLNAIGMDWISLASYAHGEDGCLAHQYLLGMFHSHYICIIEDLNLDAIDPARLERIFALPLFIEQIDSAPVTVIAELNI